MISSDASIPLTSDEVHSLWQETIRYRHAPDNQVNIRCVSEPEIQRLNKLYREKNAPTNVLTFSYEDEHDIALCLPIAKREAIERGVHYRDYIALLLVHAFLHATGMDHEKSLQEAKDTHTAEEVILQRCGFPQISLQ